VSDMLAPRENATATLLKNGRVLIVGGTELVGDSQIWILTSEIYDPATNKFTLAGDLQTARTEHASLDLPDGRVLVLGGWGVDESGNKIVFPREVDLYDPTTDTFKTIGKLSQARRVPSATLLPNGKVLV